MRANFLGVKRRRWLSEDKARLVAETRSPGVDASEVARRNDIAQSLLFTRRRQARVQTATPESISFPV